MIELGDPTQPANSQPINGDRKHYLPLWNNEDPYGDLWRRSRHGLGTVDVSKVSSLMHLEMSWRSKRTLPPLLVRIMHKSRLRYFGKPDKKIDIPYQAYFEVADHTGMMSLVLWNSLCLEWFNTFRVGSILFLQQYSVKNSYPNRTLPTPGNVQLKRFPKLEISLNARDPSSIFHIIEEKLVKPNWRLPDVKYQFITRLELDQLPHNSVCDVIGLVTYVGRCERKRRDDSEDFWVYRWVQMIDGTTDQPFVLEIFATSQPEIFEHIHPMSYLVCTQMRLIREFPDDVSTAYLTTSNESQVFISGHHKGQPYTVDNKVKSFIDWTKTQNETDLVKSTVIGGYHRYPLTPATFAKYCKDNKVESILTTFSELKKSIANLHYRESKRIAIQGIIAALQFVACNRKSKEISRREADQGVEASTGQEGAEPQDDGAELYTPQRRSNTVNQIKRRKRLYQPDENPLLSSESPSLLHEPIHSQGISSSEMKPFGANEEVNNEMKESSAVSWQSELWSEVKHTIEEHLHYKNVCPESVPRKFDYFHKEFLMQQYNLQTSKLSTKMCASHKELNQFALASSLGHYELTILGINQRVAMDVLYLPDPCPGEPDINSVPHNHQRLQGASTPESEAAEMSDPGSSSEGDFMKFVNTLDREHIICILDICHLGDNKVEVCLNSMYNPVQTNDGESIS